MSAELTNDELREMAAELQAELDEMRGEREAGMAAHSAASGGQPLPSGDAAPEDQPFDWNNLSKPYDPTPDTTLKAADVPERNDRGQPLTTDEKWAALWAGAAARGDA